MRGDLPLAEANPIMGQASSKRARHVSLEPTPGKVACRAQGEDFFKDEVFSLSSCEGSSDQPRSEWAFLPPGLAEVVSAILVPRASNAKMSSTHLQEPDLDTILDTCQGLRGMAAARKDQAKIRPFAYIVDVSHI
eukprot:scaffold3097_cov31-Prasinocladus_malaysianus.AAC.1